MNNSVEWRDKEPYCTECETKLPGIRGFWFKNCPDAAHAPIGNPPTS